MKAFFEKVKVFSLERIGKMKESYNQSKRKKKSGSSKKMKGWQKGLIIALAVLVLLAGTMVGAVYHVVGRIDTQEREVQSNIADLPDVVTESEEIPEGYEVLDEYEIINADGVPIKSSKDVTNILLIGTDKYEKNKSYSRSDTMIILSIDNKNQKLKMTSLLRDLYVTIPGRKNADRLNHSHSYGGPDLLIRTIEYNFRVKIDKYLRVNFDTFEKVIDRLGGVNVNLTAAEAGIVVDTAKAGTYHLNGEQARSFSRIRSLDSDFGRTNRQRIVITSVINDLKQKDIATLTSLMYDILPMVTTDYNSTELIGLIMQSPKLSSYEIMTNRFPQDNSYRGVYIRGMAVLVTDLEVAATQLQEFIYG